MITTKNRRKLLPAGWISPTAVKKSIRLSACPTYNSKAGAVIPPCLILVCWMGLKPLKDRMCLFKFLLCAELAISTCHSKCFNAA